jgi:Mn-dependent DtxR family transcriptional regulator
MSDETYPTAAINAVNSLLVFLGKRGVKTEARQRAFLILAREGIISAIDLADELNISVPAAGEAIAALEYPANLATREIIHGRRYGKISDEGKKKALAFNLIRKEEGDE